MLPREQQEGQELHAFAARVEGDAPVLNPVYRVVLVMDLQACADSRVIKAIIAEFGPPIPFGDVIGRPLHVLLLGICRMNGCGFFFGHAVLRHLIRRREFLRWLYQATFDILGDEFHGFDVAFIGEL